MAGVEDLVFAHPQDLLSFDTSAKIIDEFVDLLRKKEIAVDDASPLGKGLDLVREMKRRHDNIDAETGWASLAPDLQEALGVLHFARLTLRQRHKPDFDRLIPHFKLMLTSEVAQTKKVPSADQGANKLFEMFVALLALETCSDLEMEDPNDSNDARNPDVLARMADGRLWGFACKVIHGDSPMTFFENVERGVAQIDGSKADVGIVIFSLKNKLPHEQLLPEQGDDGTGYPTLGVHSDIGPAIWAMRKVANDRVDQMEHHVGKQVIWEALRGKKALPGIIISMSAGVGVLTQLGPAPTILSIMQLRVFEHSPLYLPSRFTDRELSVMESLNWGTRLMDRPSGAYG